MNRNPAQHRRRLLGLVVAGAVLAVAWVGFSALRARSGWEREVKVHAPSVVKGLALRFRLLHPWGAGVYPGETLERQFAYNFFGGFTCGKGCGVQTDSQLTTDAYMAGVRYRTEHPENGDIVMAGFGYSHFEGDGMWVRGYEKNSFSPLEAPTQDWTIDYFEKPEQAWRFQWPGQPMLDNGAARVHVVGYLSPEGQYGHLGQHSRQLLAVTVGYYPQ